MITEKVRLITCRGRHFWQHRTNTGWQIVSEKFARHLLQAHGFSQQEACRLMICTPPVEAEPQWLVTRLVDIQDCVIGYRVQTWIGPRYASEKAVVAWLRRVGFSPNEVDSLFAIADSVTVSASEAKTIRTLAEHGIRV
jgi:hypothetical protein